MFKLWFLQLRAKIYSWDSIFSHSGHMQPPPNLSPETGLKKIQPIAEVKTSNFGTGDGIAS